MVGDNNNERAKPSPDFGVSIASDSLAALLLSLKEYGDNDAGETDTASDIPRRVLGVIDDESDADVDRERKLEFRGGSTGRADGDPGTDSDWPMGFCGDSGVSAVAPAAASAGSAAAVLKLLPVVVSAATSLPVLLVLLFLSALFMVVFLLPLPVLPLPPLPLLERINVLDSRRPIELALFMPLLARLWPLAPAPPSPRPQAPELNVLDSCRPIELDLLLPTSPLPPPLLLLLSSLLLLTEEVGTEEDRDFAERRIIAKGLDLAIPARNVLLLERSGFPLSSSWRVIVAAVMPVLAGVFVPDVDVPLFPDVDDDDDDGVTFAAGAATHEGGLVPTSGL